MDMIQKNWKEAAFSSPAKLDVIHSRQMGPPCTSSLKLNFDGSARGNLGVVRVGGIILFFPSRGLPVSAWQMLQSYWLLGSALEKPTFEPTQFNY